jgi:hypothetical protein
MTNSLRGIAWEKRGLGETKEIYFLLFFVRNIPQGGKFSGSRLPKVSTSLSPEHQLSQPHLRPERLMKALLNDNF